MVNGRPNRFKIYAPDGHSEEVVGWLALGYTPPPDEQHALTLHGMEGKVVALNPLCVVVDVEVKRIAYDPRVEPEPPPWGKKGLSVLGETHREWLKKNPHWPGVVTKETDAEPASTWKWEEDQTWETGG